MSSKIYPFKGARVSRTTICIILILTVLWIVLRENVSIPTVASGIAISAACLFFCRKFLPFSKIKNLKLLRLCLYPFYVIGQIYLAGFKTIKMIITGADADIIEIKTRLSDIFLQTILSNTITLIPGSISLELKDNAITVLWLKDKSKDLQHAQNTGESIKGKLERILLKIER